MQITCKICDTKWNCYEYSNTKCPCCGQEYVYDEDIRIELTQLQIDTLRKVYLVKSY